MPNLRLMGKIFCCQSVALVEAGLAQSVERLTAEREVAGSIPVAEPILRVLIKITEKWRYSLCTAISARPRKMAVPSPVGEVKILSPVTTFVLNTLTLKSSAVVFFFLDSGHVEFDNRNAPQVSKTRESGYGLIHTVYEGFLTGWNN